jgi:cytochrome c-type biogenesis protein
VSDVGFVVAFGGGVVSFVSPCVLPVVPSYLSTIAGLDLSEPNSGSSVQLGRVARDTFLFFCGFGAVICALGLAATALGRLLVRNQILLQRISGGVVVAMACYLLATVVAKSPRLFGEVRFHPRPSRLGPFAAPVLGAAFAFGWTPCLGPVLASLTAAASDAHGFGRAAILLLVYSAGLGFPFLVLGCAFSQLSGVVGFLRRSGTAITVGSGALLLAFGILLIVGHLSWVTSEAEAALRAIGLGRLVTVG